ncbi:MAG: serine/threonine-protein kinase [Gemmatimonadota bacterium]
MSDLLRERVGAALGSLYEIEGELGRGGMGVVYRAMDRKLRRAVAIKVLPPELAYRDDVKQRFLREAQTAAQLNHPNIVPIYAVEERDGLVCFVMALVEGEPLSLRLATEHRPPLAEVFGILRGVADALAYAHARGIVHRDIKPDNILIDRATGRPMVTDFGIARAAEGDARLTVTGIAVGTPAYMSPEQAMGEREIDGRSDLYSLAIVAYQMLTGELPFRATNTPSMLMKHISDTARPLRECRRDLPPLLVSAVERAMAKRPQDRWEDAGSFRDAIAAVEAGMSSLRASAPTPSEAPVPERHVDIDHLSSAWKHRAPRIDGLAANVRDIVRGSQRTARSASKMAKDIERDAIEASNAGWGAPLARPVRNMLQPLPPVPPWMPDSWRDVRDRSRMVGRDSRQRDALRGRESMETFGQLSVADRIRSFRRRSASSAVTVGMLAAINLAFSPTFLWFIFPAIGMSIPLAQRLASLWADGVRFRDIFGREAQKAMKAQGDGRSAIRSLPSPAQLAREMVPEDVLAGPYGDYVRRAAGDRLAVQEVLGKLTKADLDLIPDVAPTMHALAERVASVAQALHRLEEDVRPSAIDELDRRIAATRAQPESRERDQRLQLLERQRVTTVDLRARHETLLTQLESASLVLQNMRLDMIALRSAGVQSAMDDVSSATQEARALSRDIANVLDAAKEVR